MSRLPSIIHLVNVVGIDGVHPSYLHIAQPVTLASMVQARAMALGHVQVDLLAVRHPKEAVRCPPEFLDLPVLQRSCRDVFPQLAHSEDPRELPLLVDLLDALQSQCLDHDLCVYTNVDIGLQPSFYLDIAEKSLNQGLDAFCINKRIKPKMAWGIELTERHLPLLHALEGIPGGGTDCFVFKPALLREIQVGNVFLGYPPIGRVLRLQLQARAKRFEWYKGLHLTFHLGDDQIWNQPDHPHYLANLKAEQDLTI
ncbi:MAG: hypothetical protein VKP63_04305 [Cyanobacteriota bacterium]|nr:hypothetical protein [Cyanobacteriota bacterium]